MSKGIYTRTKLAWNKGKKRPLEERQAISRTMLSLGLKDPNLKKDFTCQHCGKIFNEYISHKKKYCNHSCASAHTKNSLGKKRTPETREKIRQANFKREWGAKCWNWKGGISKIDKIVRRMPEYITWRGEVFKRDSFICKCCGLTGYVTAHHKKSFSSILKENNIKNTEDARNCKELWNIENGVTLCELCHSLTDNYKGRNKNK